MDSRRLSERLRQPGHDQTYRRSERDFVAALRAILPSEAYEVVDHPQELRALFAAIDDTGGALGLVPEASVTNKRTGRVMYFEVKKQGPAGNAEERACKHHTVQFYKTLSDFTGYDYHAYVTIFCESLATMPRYTQKFLYLFEREHYFLWVDYDLDLLAAFVHETCSRFLDSATVAARPEDIPV